MADHESFWQKLTGIFLSRKLDPQAKLREIGKEIHELRRQAAGLKHDVGVLGREADKIKQRATKAHREGQALDFDDAAEELNLKLKEVRIRKRDLRLVRRTASVLARVELQLKSHLETGHAGAVTRALALVQDQKMRDLIADTRITDEALMDTVDRELAVSSAMDARVEATRRDAELEGLKGELINLAQAEANGDAEAVAKFEDDIMAKRTAVGPEPEAE